MSGQYATQTKAQRNSIAESCPQPKGAILEQITEKSGCLKPLVSTTNKAPHLIIQGAAAYCEVL